MKHINLFEPYVCAEAKAAVAEVLNTRWVGQGPKVEEFERIFRERFAPPGYAAVAVSSCTAALHLAYLLAGIKVGDDVICPLFTCTATNIPLLWIGAKLHFCDVEPGGLNMDLSAAIRLKQQYPYARTVIVHYGGKPCVLEADIEDCAQSLGTNIEPQIGAYSCYSFQAVKHVTTGDGGMLVLPEEQADQARRMRWFGIDRKGKLSGTWANEICEVGYKYQMTDIAAAMGIANLAKLDWQMEHRRYLRQIYIERLEGTGWIHVLDHDPDSACWLMTVLVERREDLRRKLAERGIESDQVHYRNDRYKVFNRHIYRQYPNMDAMEPRYLCLPSHANLTAEDVHYVVDVIKEGW